MSRRSYARYSELLGRAGVRLIRNHELFRDRQPPPDYLADILPDLEATDDDRLPSGFTYRWSGTTVAIETPLFMRWLMARIAECHVRVRRATVSSLAEFSRRDQDAVVNCSGLGARDLASDPTVRPVKGQLLLHDPIPYDEALGAHEYGVLPRADALVLGSLFQERFDHCEPTEENTDRIWAEISGWERVAGGCVGLPPGALRRSRIRRTIAGLRPYRAPGIRLQVEQVGDLPVIHNYGHGGSGYTLAWGCAESVVGLLKSL
jgi:D-amino-acid oxidase